MVKKHDLQVTTKELRDTSGHHHTSDNQVGKTTVSKIEKLAYTMTFDYLGIDFPRSLS